MLLKIDFVNEIGRFSSLKHKAPQFDQLSLIYGRNGYGKSTLCSILRSAADQDAKMIAARRKLGAAAESLVQLQWANSITLAYAAGKWNKQPTPLFVFDQEYVRKNVHVAENVTRENKRNLLRVVLGATGLGLAKKVSDLDEEQRTLGMQITNFEKTIRTAHPTVTDVIALVEAQVPANIDSQILSAEKTLELVRQAAAIKQKKDLKRLPIIDIDSYQTLIQKSIEDISDDAAALIQSHLARYEMLDHGERWIKYGIAHIKEESCPLCTQSIKDSAPIDSFKGYFSAAYADLVKKIEAKLVELRNFHVGQTESFASIFKDNATDMLFWSTVCDFDNVEKITENDKKVALSVVEFLVNLMEKKLKNPLDSFVSIDFLEAMSGIDAVNRYNQWVANCASVIDSARLEAVNSDVAKSSEVLGKRKALKAKLEAPLKDVIAEWKISSKRRASVEIEKKQTQDALKAYVKTTITTKQKDINDLLMLFGANFQLVDTKASFVGREANTEYSIAIGSHAIKAGEASNSEPGFNSILSSGDKFTLALALFITQVRADPNLSTATIIFDDPFSSQDMQRQFETTSQLRALSKDAAQVVVLSHDPRFLHLIEKNAGTSPCSTFQLTCDDGGIGAISPWSSADELKELYIRYAERIREYASFGKLLEGNEEALIVILRPFLEDYIRARFPSRFKPLAMLGDMTDDIEKAGVADPLFVNVADFRAINEYSRPNMHGGAAAPDPGQLRAQCKRIILIVGAY